MSGSQSIAQTSRFSSQNIDSLLLAIENNKKDNVQKAYCLDQVVRYYINNEDFDAANKYVKEFGIQSEKLKNKNVSMLYQYRKAKVAYYESDKNEMDTTVYINSYYYFKQYDPGLHEHGIALELAFYLDGKTGSGGYMRGSVEQVAKWYAILCEYEKYPADIFEKLYLGENAKAFEQTLISSNPELLLEFYEFQMYLLEFDDSHGGAYRSFQFVGEWTDKYRLLLAKLDPAASKKLEARIIEQDAPGFEDPITRMERESNEKMQKERKSRKFKAAIVPFSITIVYLFLSFFIAFKFMRDMSKFKISAHICLFHGGSILVFLIATLSTNYKSGAIFSLLAILFIFQTVLPLFLLIRYGNGKVTISKIIGSVAVWGIIFVFISLLIGLFVISNSGKASIAWLVIQLVIGHILYYGMLIVMILFTYMILSLFVKPKLETIDNTKKDIDNWL